MEDGLHQARGQREPPRARHRRQPLHQDLAHAALDDLAAEELVAQANPQVDHALGLLAVRRERPGRQHGDRFGHGDGLSPVPAA